MKVNSERYGASTIDLTQRDDVSPKRTTWGLDYLGAKGPQRRQGSNVGASRRRSLKPRASPATFALGLLATAACFPQSPPVGAVENVGDTDPTAESLLVFGGPSHDVFLGCLCGKLDADSIDNPSGPHGSLSANESVRNRQGPYGSPDSAESACNMTASEPPIVVDRAGVSRGRLSVNPHKARDHDLMTRAQRICEGG